MNLYEWFSDLFFQARSLSFVGIGIILLDSDWVSSRFFSLFGLGSA
jgi:hypothetical protein